LMTKLTTDHTIIQLLLDAGELSCEHVNQHPARGQLTRYIGMKGKVLPEVFSIELHPDDRLLFCTDGLTDMLKDSEIHSIVTNGHSPMEICKQLAEAANDAGGEDNITVLIVTVANIV